VRHHLRHVLVARERELGAEPGFIELLPGLEVKGVAREERGRCQAIQRRGGRHQHHVHLALANAPECREPLADQVLVRREVGVGQRFPVRKQRAAQVGREEGHLVHQAARVGCIGADDGGGVPVGGLAPGQARQQQRIAAAHGARHGVAFSADEGGELHEDETERQRHKPPAAVGRG